MLSFQESIDYLEQLYRQPFISSSIAGLERARFLLARIGNPYLAFRSVHVAGSSGKGSMAAMIGSILQEAGFDTGLFQSPHLESYRDRITINGDRIEAEDWTRHFEAILPIAEGMRRGQFADYSLGRPTLFETLFAIAARHFAEEGIAWAVMETGLGGRLDPTNLLQSDVAVITNISLEHTQILGSTISAIAGEKAAIIKDRKPVVTAAHDAEALAVIDRQARRRHSPLIQVGRDVLIANRQETATGQMLSIVHAGQRIDVDLPLHGRHQATNAATAFGAVTALRGNGLSVTTEDIERGLAATKLPGRYEVFAGRPRIVMDGAHNLAATEALVETVKAVEDEPVTLLFAAMADKDIESMAEALAPVTRQVMLAPVPGTVRSAPLARMRAAFALAGRPPQEFPDAEEALHASLRSAGDGTLLITGSLYLVGMARHILQTAPVR